MKREKHLGVSAILGKVYYGTVNKAGNGWLSKTEVNKSEFVQCIFDWVKHESKGTGVVDITSYGKPYAKIIVQYLPTDQVEEDKPKDDEYSYDALDGGATKAVDHA